MASDLEAFSYSPARGSFRQRLFRRARYQFRGPAARCPPVRFGSLDFARIAARARLLLCPFPAAIEVPSPERSSFGRRASRAARGPTPPMYPPMYPPMHPPMYPLFMDRWTPGTKPSDRHGFYLEAFSYSPARGSFCASAFSGERVTSSVNRRFLSY